MKENSKTDGIVLHTVPYNDRTAFVHIYTSQFGMSSYAISLTQSKRAKLQRALFMPLTRLSLEVEHKPARNTQKIAEAQLLSHNYSIATDPIKNAVAFFLAEFLGKVIQEHEANPPLYGYITDAISLFDLLEDGKANFHLLFLTHLAPFLGLAIARDTYREKYYFDFMEGSFVANEPMHSHFLAPHQAQWLYRLISTSFSQIQELSLNKDQRNQLLDYLVTYFRLHLADFKQINSLEVLKALF